MTIREATIAAIQLPGAPESSIDLALINQGVGDSTVIYNVTMKPQAYMAAIEVLKGMLGLAGIDEGQYSIKYDTDGILARIKFLEGELGEEDTGQPVIRDATNRW